MSDLNEILKELRLLKQQIMSERSGYCDTIEAAVIMGLTDKRQLKQLVDVGVLVRYPRGNGYVYKKSECKQIAAELDKGTIVLTGRCR